MTSYFIHAVCVMVYGVFSVVVLMVMSCVLQGMATYYSIYIFICIYLLYTLYSFHPSHCLIIY